MKETEKVKNCVKKHTTNLVIGTKVYYIVYKLYMAVVCEINYIYFI